MNLSPDIEWKSRDEIRLFQEEQLKTLISYLKTNSKFYQQLFKSHRIDFDSIESVEDLQKIPVTTKDDLFLNNEAFTCVTKEDIIDYITTSGTMGDPVTFALTDNDLDRLAYNECMSFKVCGVAKTDVIQLMTTIDRRFMAGLAYFLGARKLGAGIVRVGNGIPELQWDTIKRIKPTVIIAVPSFILKVIEYAEQHGIDYKNSSVKKAICIGEPLRNQDFSLSTLAERIKSKWDLELYSTYASTEMSTAYNECPSCTGGHEHPDLIITEFLDENNKNVGEGEPGEITVTTLGVEGMPLLRFKTGDIAYRYTEKCSCGRSSLRVGPVIGRRKQMIKYKGTTLYPAALYDVLADFNDIIDYFIEVSTNHIGTDDIQINILSTNNTTQFIKTIKDHFRAKLRVAPHVKLVDKDTITKNKYPETSRKPIVFIDLRKNT
ncbi:MULTISPECIES: phenylacetate--CoA ligase family protein [unclassified Lentimicrobium]|uniref:phenylacetate--CoA ligase family protein n=1 Tax=unclassified Lentimicrobium TaxID=2677434 RepID=UPI0015547BD7|nr:MULTISPECIES: AMP-binding protein [unclassified Lentimicrobium]NPD46229.1 AMP-binding protein [Lentimicrobium sp. S6]NPD86279.1 AMP-binding protein [Lentimicrobium sp. L6]